LDASNQGRLAGQISCINKVQRILDWRSVEFYRMRWFKVRQWPSESLFENKAEFVLGTVEVRCKELLIPITVWSVGGHVFTLEAPQPLKPLRNGGTSVERLLGGKNERAAI
jgi:hypothetical protein